MTVDEAWQYVLDESGNNMLLDTPGGKRLFAQGGAYIISRLQDDFSRDVLERLKVELRAFVAAYTAQAEEHRNSPIMQEVRAALDAWERERE